MKLESLNTSLDLFYRLEYLTRYSNVPRVHDESVASHSFFVAVIVLLLKDSYRFDLGWAVEMAISHDLPEVFTNDLSHETQRMYPKLKAAIKEAEQDSISLLPETIKEILHDYTDNDTQSTIEVGIVHLADAIQCYQYASHEIALGNVGYMAEVKSNSEGRIWQLQEQLKNHLVSEKN